MDLSNEELQAEIARRTKKKSMHECIQDVLNHLHQSEVSLKTETKVIHKVGYSDLEEYLTLVSGKTVEIPVILECGNDSVHTFNASPDKPKDGYDLINFEEAESFLFGNLDEIPTYKLRPILNVLCHYGFISSGEYVVEVSW